MKRQGFTLIELLIVLAVAAVFASAIIGAVLESAYEPAFIEGAMVEMRLDGRRGQVVEVLDAASSEDQKYRVRLVPKTETGSYEELTVYETEISHSFE